MTRRVLRFTVPSLLLILAISALSPAHAVSQYVGYVAGQASGQCPPSFCVGDGTTGAASGQIIRSPMSGQLTSFSLATGGSGTAISRVIISSFPSGSNPTLTTNACNNGGVCNHDNTGSETWTVIDNEAISVPSSAFSTVQLASPPSVTSGRWYHVGVICTSCASGIMDSCGSSPTPSCASVGNQGNIADTTIQYGSANPILGATGSPNGNWYVNSILGATFSSSPITPSSGVSQCYGNCGSPAVTLANTNSTHSINWNQTQTLFYPFQSNINGAVQNVTVSQARSYAAPFQGGQNSVDLGFYAVANTCQSGQVPFSAQCPGVLIARGGQVGMGKGLISLTGIQYNVANGQWLAVAVSATFSGMDLNDTNTALPVYQVSGDLPVSIQGYATLSASFKMGLWTWINGQIVTSTGTFGAPNSGSCSLICGAGNFVLLLGGGIWGGLFSWMIIFGGISFGFIWVGRTKDAQGRPSGHVLGEGLMPFLTLIGIVLLIAWSSVGFLSPWIPVAIIILAAWMLASMIWGRGKSGGAQT